MEARGKLFITDFDGTLLTDDKTISREDITTLANLRQKKILTAIATGRSVYSFEKALTDMGMEKQFLPIDYLIFSTGAGIMEFPRGRVIYQKALPVSAVGEITDYLDHGKLDYMVHRSIPDTHHFLYKSHGTDNPDFYARLSIYKAYAVPLDPGYCHREPATEVLAIIPGKMAVGLLKQIKKDLSRFSVIHATSPLDKTSFWIEIFHEGVSKSSSVSWLVKGLGLNRKNVLSVGNDYNDQDLLAWSGNGYVVENAPARLKQMFKTVSSNNLSGVSDAVTQSGWLTHE